MTQPDDGPFALFSSDAYLPQYDDGPEWRAFYERGALAERLVAEDDIEAYDWENQALILTEGASRRFNDRIWRFIAVLGEKRLYGGQGLRWMSAMAVRHPVIYTMNLGGRTVLLVRPFHMFASLPKLDDEYWGTVASTEVMRRFERMGKLRRPWSEKTFVDLRNSVHRIRGLRAAATELALEMRYELEGTRVGEYDLEESLSWTNGHDGMDFGPRYSSVVRLGRERSSREAVFHYAKFVWKYGDLRNADNQAKLLSAGSAWCMTVRIWPVLGKEESTSLGLVERINLDLLRWYGGDSADLVEPGAERPSHSIGDTKHIELPADWENIRRRMEALSQMRKAAFLRRLRQFIEDRTQRAPEEDALAGLFERGSGYGLVSEQQFAAYIMLAWQAGVRPPGPDPQWIAEVMSDSRRSPDGKVDALIDRASAKLAGRV